MKALLPCLLLLAGCTTTSWTEETNITRTAGSPRERTYDRPLDSRWLTLTTAREPDGFLVERQVLTGEDGVARFNLLPVALQCLVYGHDVRLALWSADEEREVHAEVINEARAVAIVDEWRIQCRLGTRVPLRSSEVTLLDRALESLGNADVVAALREIKPKVDVRPDWE